MCRVQIDEELAGRDRKHNNFQRKKPEASTWGTQGYNGLSMRLLGTGNRTVSLIQAAAPNKIFHVLAFDPFSPSAYYISIDFHTSLSEDKPQSRPHAL